MLRGITQVYDYIQKTPRLPHKDAGFVLNCT
ncbi:Uncharacterised protein [Staphylococcus chromogenes]|nr:Uncharacterised protein [Staphylococcus chromogenes]